MTEEEIAAGGPARRRGEPARRRAVRRPVDRGAGVPRRRGRPRPDSTARSSPSSRGGNVDPDRYRASSRRRSRLSRRAVGLRDRGEADPSRSPLAASRSASAASRTRIAARSASAPVDPRASSRSSCRIQPARIAAIADEEEDVADDPHHAARQLLVLERRRSPRPDERRVVRSTAATAAVQDRHREERVLGHLEEHVHRPGPGGVIRHGLGSGPTAGHQNSRRGAEEQQRARASWIERVLERRVEQRREVRPPHDRGEEQPGDDRERQRPASTREWRIGRISRAGASRRRGTRRSSVIGAARAISGAATSVSSRCWTMWTENSVVS